MVEHIQFKDRNRNHRSRESKSRRFHKKSNSSVPWIKGEKLGLDSLVIFELTIKKTIS